MAIAQGYGMIAADAPDSSTVRVSYIIDPEGVIRAMSWNPMNVGRSIDELLRLVAALQIAHREKASTPEGWQPGGRLLEPAVTDAEKALDAEPFQT